MTISHIALDTWAAGETLQLATITIVSLSLFISLTLFLIRLYQILIQSVRFFRKRIKSSSSALDISSPPALPHIQSIKHMFCTTRLLQICHLLAMFWSCLYISLYFVNYLHIFVPQHRVNCSLWLICALISITMTKVFIYTFLMLRSSLSFKSSPLFRIPLSLSVTVVAFAVTGQLLMMSLMLSNFRTFAFDNSYCFRTYGAIGTIGIVGFNICDAMSAVVALIIFWTKANHVKSKLSMNDTDDLDENDDKMVINEVFMKHITLGTLIVVGSILIFLAGEFLTILMGVASTLHQLANNVYLFLLFKENHALYVKLGSICCCGYAHPPKQTNDTEAKYKTIAINNKSDNVIEIEGSIQIDKGPVVNPQTQTRNN